MANFYDIAYATGLGVLAPYWGLRTKSRKKVMSAFRQRMGHVPMRPLDRPAIMIHAVSLGEINAIRSLVEGIRKQKPGWHFVVSTTTQTGFEQGTKLFGEQSDVTLIRFPLDFSKAVSRVLDAMKPTAVVLMELEVWPNFMRACEARGIPVVLANGRITTRSYRGYRRILPVARGMFRKLTKVCAQDPTYAKRFIDLGAREQDVVITGTMKFDNATIADRVEGDAELAWSVGLIPGQDFIWVCGSTGPGEEELILEQYRQLLSPPNGFRHRLAIIPRHPERFEEVAQLIQDFRFRVVRRSDPGRPGPNTDAIPPVVLGNTMGELRKFYSIADLVFVGRTLVDLGARQHGSDMIEPAALGKPTIVGPFTTNFAEAMNRLRESEAVLEVGTAAELGQSVRVLYSTPKERLAMGSRAREVVRANQGSTRRHIDIILNVCRKVLR